MKIKIASDVNQALKKSIREIKMMEYGEIGILFKIHGGKIKFIILSKKENVKVNTTQKQFVNEFEVLESLKGLEEISQEVIK